MKITLKDGSVREYDRPMSAYEIACDISEGLGRMACLACINGEDKKPESKFEEPVEETKESDEANN